MNLPAKALFALASIRQELLSRDAVEVEVPEPKVAAAPRKTRVRSSGKAAYSRHNAFQRMCQRKDWASPVY